MTTAIDSAPLLRQRDLREILAEGREAPDLERSCMPAPRNQERGTFDAKAIYLRETTVRQPSLNRETNLLEFAKLDQIRTNMRHALYQSVVPLEESLRLLAALRENKLSGSALFKAFDAAEGRSPIDVEEVLGRISIFSTLLAKERALSALINNERLPKTERASAQLDRRELLRSVEFEIEDLQLSHQHFERMANLAKSRASRDPSNLENILIAAELTALETEFIKQRNKIVEGNLRLVLKIAGRYTGIMEFMDAVEYGNLGLIRAVERFDSNREVSFSHYASFWIKQAIREGLTSNAHTIKLPAELFYVLRKIRRAQEIYDLEHPRETPSTAYLSEICGESEATIKALLPLIKPPLSLQQPRFNDDPDDDKLEAQLVDPSALDSDHPLTRHAAVSSLNEAFDHLTPKERNVITTRYPIGSELPCLDRAEAAEALGLTTEQIRRTEELAFRKLRHPSNGKLLRALAAELS